MTLYDYFIPYKKGGGAIVDWDFQSIIHCFNWYDLQGYSQTGISYPKRKVLLMHKLLTGYSEVDHINGQKNDNRLSNLQDVTHRQNLQNRIEHRKGKLPGANYDKSVGWWKAQIKINGKTKTIGCYKTEQEAHEAYMEETL